MQHAQQTAGEPQFGRAGSTSATVGINACREETGLSRFVTCAVLADLELGGMNVIKPHSIRYDNFVFSVSGKVANWADEKTTLVELCNLEGKTCFTVFVLLCK